jgi:hypothetical protein
VKFRLLVAVPFVALAALLVALAVVPAAHHALVYRITVELAKTVALVGCAAAGLRFAPGDYLRTAWLLQAQCYLLILLNDIFFRAGLGVTSTQSWAPTAGAVVVLVANAGQLVGTVMIARAWRVAGIELAGSPTVRWLVAAGALAVALVAGGWLVVTSARDAAHGQSGALVDLFSSVADIVSFALIAPLVLTAIALRGGTLAWTWTLFTASLFGWLLFDATLSFGPRLLADAASIEKVSECFRLLACTFGMAAGLAQRFAVGNLPRESSPVEAAT